MKYKNTAKVWLWGGEMGSWHFAYVDKKYAEDIKSRQKNRRGFGAVKVRVTLGKTKWETSIFPSKKDGTYLLPLKESVRVLEGVRDGDQITYTIELI